MHELITIRETNGKQAVSARELHEKLGLDASQWKRWYVKNIINNPFAFENQDWQVLDIMSKTSEGGRPTKDFALSLDFAKRLSMLARTEKGEQIRSYFVAMEKQAITAVQQIEPEELMVRQAQALLDQKRRVAVIENDVRLLKAQTITRPDYFTIAGFCTINGMKVNLQTASRLGSAAAKLCRENKYEMGECPDPRFGKVRTYPREVLEFVLKQPVI